MAQKTKTVPPLPTPPPLIVPTATYAQRMQGLSRPDRVTPVVPPPMINNLNGTATVQQSPDYFMSNANTAVTPYEQISNETQNLGQQYDWQGLAQQPQNTGWFDNVTNTLQNKDLMTGLSGLASAIGTGADVYNKFWGPQAKATEAQTRNANAQAAYNEGALKHKNEFYAGLANSGLVAKGV